MNGNKYNYIDYIKILFQRGPGFFIQYFINNYWFDFKRGVDTHKRQSLEEYSIKPRGFEHGVWYVGVKTSTLNSIFKNLAFTLKEDIKEYQFIDLGCGKGKSLIYFIEYFKHLRGHKAIGIEYDHKLAAIARSNLKKLKLDSQAEIITNDARTFSKYTSSKKIIVFMYNPFDWSVMKIVMKTILGNYEAIICYVDPVNSKHIIDLGYSLQMSNKGKYPADNINIFVKTV